MMLFKCFTQYASKVGRLSSGHRTGNDQFSFKFQRRAMSKNVQTTAQLHSFHMQAGSHSKSSKLGFNSTWNKNFDMYKLDLEKAGEPEITLPRSARSQTKQENFRKTSTTASLTKAFNCVHHKNCVENCERDVNTNNLTSLLWNL